MAGLASLAVRRGDYADGAVLADAVLAREPGYPPALLVLAESAIGRDDMAGAERSLGQLATGIPIYAAAACDRPKPFR